MRLSDWMLIVGIPVIVILGTMAYKRIIALRARIDQFRQEQEANRQDPYAELAELWANRNKRK